jgi:hypothetical protein
MPAGDGARVNWAGGGVGVVPEFMSVIVCIRLYFLK